MSKDRETKQRGTIRSSLAAWWEKIPPDYRLILALVVPAVALVIVGIVLSRRAPALTPTAAPPTATLAPCSTELIRGDVEEVHAIMLEFYDASALASYTPAEQLVDVIPNLQEIRRRAQALKVSPCLDTLRSYQLSHMNMVINTLLAFIAQADQSILMDGIIQAQLLNEAYKKEKARLLGEEYVPPSTRTPVPATETVTPQLTATP